MACAACSLPDGVSTAERLYLWPAHGHMAQRIDHALGPTVVRRREWEHGGCMAYHLVNAGSALVRLAGALNDQERRDSSALLMPDKDPGLGDFGAICSIGVLMDRMRGEWLVKLLKEGRYRSDVQPILCAKTGARYGFEYLLRGMDDNGDDISPGALFESAREEKTLFNLDRSARIKAVETAAKHRLDGKVFINFLPGSIYDPTVCLRTTADAVYRNGLTPDRVVFEVVETQKYEDLAHLRGVIAFYRQSGFQIALDDFGSGYNNLDVYYALRPDYIKIDKSLIGRLGEEDTSALVAGLIQDCRSAGVSTIAEGVETEATAQRCRALGVTYMQGYLFGRPAHAATFADVKAAE